MYCQNEPILYLVIKKNINLLSGVVYVHIMAYLIGVAAGAGATTSSARNHVVLCAVHSIKCCFNVHYAKKCSDRSMTA